MSNINGVKITKQNGDLSAGPSGNDRISGMIGGVATAPSGLAFGTVAELDRLKDAEDLGIDAAYDSDNSELLWWHIREFFRMSPEGKLWLLLVDHSVSPVNPDDLFADTGVAYCKKLINSAGGEIRQLGMLLRTADLAGTYTDGLDDEIIAAIPAAQTFAEWCYTNHKPLNVIIECPDIQTPYSSLTDLRAMAAEYNKVSLVIGMDSDIADDDAAYAKRAALGTCLGMVSLRAVNEDIGWVGPGNITDANRGYFVNACLSDGTAIEDVEADWQGLDDDGYIFVLPYTGLAGYRFNSDHTACLTTNDERSISRGRTKDKAARVLRAALLPAVKSPQLVDPDTGKLTPAVIKYFEKLANSALDTEMTNQEEISGRKTTVDPDSDLLTGDQTLNVAFGVVPTGKVGEIEGTLQFETSV